MNSKLVWAVIVVLIVYGGYLMMGKTEAPVVEAPVVTEEVATTTEDVVVDMNATTTEEMAVEEIPAAN